VSSDRRRHRRFTLQLDAQVTTGASETPMKGSLMELSVGGAFVGAEVDVEAGGSVFMRFTYQDELKCEATGHIVRILPFGRSKGIAIRFGVTNPALQALLRTLAQMPESLQPDLLGSISQVRVRFG
jgi:Tfp pilus assembly protein PilZ